MKKAILLVALAVFGAVPATAQLATSDPVAAIDNIPPAPVTDLQGKSAAKASLRRRPARACAVMVDVICQTVGKAWTSNREGTLTLPTSAMRDSSVWAAASL